MNINKKACSVAIPELRIRYYAVFAQLEALFLLDPHDKGAALIEATLYGG